MSFILRATIKCKKWSASKLMKLNVENVSLPGKVIRRHFATFPLRAVRNAHNSEVWVEGRKGVCWEETGCSLTMWEWLLAQHQQISSQFFGGKWSSWRDLTADLKLQDLHHTDLQQKSQEEPSWGPSIGRVVESRGLEPDFCNEYLQVKIYGPRASWWDSLCSFHNETFGFFLF